MDIKMKIKLGKYIFFLLLFSAPYSYAKEDIHSPEVDPPDTGNFLLSTSEQPGPLIGFGENIIDKNQWQYFFQADEIEGDGKYSIEAVPSILYGITDRFS